MTGPANPATIPEGGWPEELSPGRPVEVAPGVRRIIAPNPGLMTGPGTNTYLIGGDDLALVDPGPVDDDHLELLCELSAGRLRWILVTHTHVDHSPLAARLKELTGAQVIAFAPAPSPRRPVRRRRRRAAAKVIDPHDATLAPDRLMADGESLDTGDALIEAVHTPGHTSNHLCFGLHGTGLLFSGDHVMSGSTVVIAPPDGDMADYLESLEKIRARRPARIAPGHGDMIEDPASVLDGYLRHRWERERQVVEGLRASAQGGTRGATTEELVAVIYADVPEVLHPVARYSVWAHLRKLRDDGLAEADDPEDPDSPWRPRTANRA